MKYIDKQLVKEVFENMMIEFQEEATSSWNSETERNIYNKVLDLTNKAFQKLDVRE